MADTTDELIPEFKARKLAIELNAQLEACEDESEVPAILLAFRAAMALVCIKQDSYAYLEVVGLGALREAFVWWADDNSILLVGWKTPSELAVGVLGPESTFTPTAYEGGKGHTLH